MREESLKPRSVFHCEANFDGHLPVLHFSLFYVAARFDYNYSDGEIEEVAQRSQALARDADELHIVFNNNNLDYAPRAAIRLRKALGQHVVASAQTPELF